MAKWILVMVLVLSGTAHAQPPPHQPYGAAMTPTPDCRAIVRTEIAAIPTPTADCEHGGECFRVGRPRLCPTPKPSLAYRLWEWVCSWGVSDAGAQCPPGMACVSVSATWTPFITRTPTATRSATRTRTSTSPRPPTRTGTTAPTRIPTRTPTWRTVPPTGSVFHPAMWEQQGGGPGSGGYVDLPPLRLPLRPICSWSAGPAGEIGALTAVRHSSGAERIAEFYTTCAGYGGSGCPWLAGADHTPAFYGRLRDPDTCAIVAEGGSSSAVQATYSGTTPDWFRTPSGYTLARWWEGGLCYANMPSGSALQLGATGSYQESWADCQHSEALDLLCCESHWGFIGGTSAWLGCNRLSDPKVAVRFWTGEPFYAGKPNDQLDDVYGDVAIAESTRAVVASMMFQQVGKEAKRGLYVYDVDTKARRCFFPGEFRAPAVDPSGRIAYVVQQDQVLAEIDTATCGRRDYVLEMGSPWQSAPVVAPDMVYLLETPLAATDARETADVVAVTRSTMARAWRAPVAVLYPQEVMPYWFRSDVTQMAADQGSLYVAGRDGMLVVDRKTGDVLQEYRHPSAPEGFARLVRWGDRLMAENHFALRQYPLCQATLCANPAKSPRVDYANCCRNLHPLCPDRSPSCDWWNTEDSRYRVLQSNFAQVWGGTP